jgi:very-short-patch-repair endonuclease
MSSSSDVALMRDRARRLFLFLKELAQLRSKVERTCDDYPHVIWLADLPEAPEHISFRQPTDSSEPSATQVWLEVQQPQLPAPPPVPVTIRAWLSDKELRNSDQPAPQPKPFIERFAGAEEECAKDLLEDHPEVHAQLEEYVKAWWLEWAEKDRHLKAIRKVYESLYEIYQLQQEVGESYEFLVGVGLLTWRPGVEPIRRHILTTRASLSFDAARATLIVAPPATGAEVVLEQDMIDISDRPRRLDRNSITKVVEELNGDIWNEGKLEDVLKSWIHTVSPRGRFDSSHKPPSSYTVDPVVTLAPALILRTRTEQSFIQVCEKISDQIEQSSEVPLGIRRLVEISDDAEEETVPAQEEKEIYFPLLSNPAQREIAQRLATRQGVLVQGPPGTGKSQTIANLVCHLLATGQRVLVTSHTARALSVLRDKFPEDLQALCVTVIGEDNNEILKGLEDSVRGITARHQSWNPAQSFTEEAELENHLRGLRAQEQGILEQLTALRASDIETHTSKYGDYVGSTQQIAIRLYSEKDKYGWLADEPDLDTPVPLTNEEGQRLLQLIREFQPATENEAGLQLIGLGNVPTPEQFLEHVRNEIALATKVKDCAEFTQDSDFECMVKLTEAERQQMVTDITEIADCLKTLLESEQAWVRAAAKDMTSNSDRPWRELAALTKEQLTRAESLAFLVNDCSVTGLGSKSISGVKADAQDLKTHLESGGKLGFGPFRAQVAKDAIYLTKEVFLNGRRCDNIEQLDALIEYLEFEECVKVLVKNWRGVGERFNGSPITQVATFRVLYEELQFAISLNERLQDIQTRLVKAGIKRKINWSNDSEPRVLAGIVKMASTFAKLSSIQNDFENLISALQQIGIYATAHPIHQQLAAAANTRDDISYAGLYKHLSELHQQRNLYVERNKLFFAFRESAPLTAANLHERFHLDVWNERFQSIEGAWNWSKALRWIRDLSRPEAEVELIKQLEDCGQQIRNALGRLATLKAWARCFERLSEKERQYLVAWTKAVKRIGKGTGKYANRHRQSARDSMQHCKSAIPAWIMPIHKVAETIEPGQDSFDVVIVDEASQSGPEALFLQYLAKKIVVVGDDKQISPDFVGFNREHVEMLRQRHILDLPHSEALGLENSFFDQAEIRYGGRIRMREHFRCMPEIIQFSNNLCYESEPLIPLRQFGAERLTPLVSTYVEDGYLTQDSKLINPPEADLLVEQIKTCIADASYAGKTLGVISLMNTSQQAKYIEDRLKKEIPLSELEARKIRVGDPYDFQGDERDVIFLSMVSASSEGRKIGPLTKDKDARRFNVAASRARDQMWLFHSVTTDQLSPKCLRTQLIEYFQTPQLESTVSDEIDIDALQSSLAKYRSGETTEMPAKPFETWLEAEVYLQLKERGFTVLPKLELNGYPIDLVVEGRSVRLAIECEGDTWVGAEQYHRDLARQRELERCGMTFVRIRGSAYYLEPIKALDPLWQQLENAGIKPKVVKSQRAAEIVPMVPSAVQQIAH